MKNGAGKITQLFDDESLSDYSVDAFERGNMYAPTQAPYMDDFSLGSYGEEQGAPYLDDFSLGQAPTAQEINTAAGSDRGRNMLVLAALGLAVLFFGKK